MEALVSTAWLAERIGQPGLLVADVRWYLDPARQGRAEYAKGHLPGAVFVDVSEDLAGPRRPGSGRHPWPDEAQVARVMSRIGVTPATTVVAYDDQGGATAGRLWYVLRAHGHDAVAVLDGGIQAWVAEGRPLETATPAPAASTFEAHLRPGFVVTRADLTGAQPPRLLLDARAGERYRGEVEPIDPRAGHIPGARSAPFTDNLEGGRFRSPEDLRARFAALGADREEPVVYCGSGVTACHDLLALHRAGLRGRLYAGSWSEWSSDPALPVATGG